MTRVWQAVMLAALLLPQPLRGEEGGARPPVWTPLQIQTSVFSRELGLLDAERDEFATHLANCAAQAILDGKSSPAAFAQARRMMALALNLSPRNRRALVLNFQLAKGLPPATGKGDFTPPTMARLLLARGQILTKSDSAENHLLARMFCRLAAELDPKNEDAIYASEVDRVDHGEVDWEQLTRKSAAPVTRPPGASAPQ